MAPQAQDWRPRASLATLRRRADLVERTRAFFRARGVLEVDTPVLQPGANLDRGVQPFALSAGPEGPRWLPTSPEHPLKRLVAAGAGAVWTLAPAFRRGERGRRHLPEFRMLEWYRPGWDDLRLREEALDLLRGLTGLDGEVEVLAWRTAMTRHAGIDPFTADHAALAAALGPDAGAAGADRGAALDLLQATRVDPRLGRDRWTVVVDWPPWAAAQARLRRDPAGEPVAARFEIYRDGLELANGYWELDDAAELGARQAAELRAPQREGQAPDPRFAAAMAHGLGDCAGVAVGFDRVAMLALGLDDIADTVAFPGG